MKQVRLATEQDLPFLMEALLHCDYEKVLGDDAEERIAYSLNRGLMTGFILTDNGKADACLLCANSDTDGAAYIDGLYRKEDASGSGFEDMRTLFHYTTTVLRGIGYKDMKWEISTRNPNFSRLIKAYQRILGASVVSVSMSVDVEVALGKLEA